MGGGGSAKHLLISKLDPNLEGAERLTRIWINLTSN